MGKSTLILGATDNPSRYAYLAALRLKEKGHEVFLVGNRKGLVDGMEIMTKTEGLKDIDTLTLYLNPEIQKQYYDFIISLKPKRIIFNPGTENPELRRLAQANGIETVEACTLVMLSVGNY